MASYKIECGMVPVTRDTVTEAIDYALEFCSDATITQDGRTVGWVSNKRGPSRAHCSPHPSADTDEFHAFVAKESELKKEAEDARENAG